MNDPGRKLFNCSILNQNPLFYGWMESHWNEYQIVVKMSVKVALNAKVPIPGDKHSGFMDAQLYEKL